ncbi:protein adenylyltransferase SelO, mitochondrial-like [Antedon mediterranea]|uniref:protein adenylyltransferase SelO, mitochondrial-like n=1 Tax=Antedon mediterranea TaxID=105859 RepID=UPI003AF7F874
MLSNLSKNKHTFSRFLSNIVNAIRSSNLNKPSFCNSSHSNMTATLETLNFDNLALRSLPIDEEKRNFTRQVRGACFSKVSPTAVADDPELVAYSEDVLTGLLDLPESELRRDDFAEYFSGNKLLPGCDPAAHCYCGHQFGSFAGQLGDGATMYLGEILNKRNERWEIQFKGAGLTPFSRSADGRKVLRSTIREFLCSEAMHHLGIPTTRAGTCVTSDTMVIRDIHYNGNAIRERASIVLRVAQTFLRFGSFEIFKPTDSHTGRQGPSVGRKDVLETLLNYTVQTFFSEIYEKKKENKEEMYLEFYKEVVRLTIQLVVGWQCVGFCHGVLNTDNMSIVGLTIDYGPFGFMDRFDPDFICNASDDGGRYTYAKQPPICKWNLVKLAEAISMALPLEKSKEALEEIYDQEYEKCYLEKMRKKIGLLKALPEDKSLIESFLETMQLTGADFTNCFRGLTKVPLPGSPDAESAIAGVLEYYLTQCCTAETLKKSNQPRMHPRQLEMYMMLAQMNPDLLAQLGQGHQMLLQEIERMKKSKEMESLTDKEKRKTDSEMWSKWLKLYSSRLEAEIETSQTEEFIKNRIESMNRNNPKYILRNYIAQNAIDEAEKGNFSEVRRVLKLLQDPYSDKVNVDAKDDVNTGKEEAPQGASSSSAGSSETPSSCRGTRYDDLPPDWALSLKVT